MNYDSEAICELRIPNQEIKVVFNTEILRNLKNLVSPSISKRLRVALFTTNSALFVETIHEFLLQSASNYDTSSESFYYGMVLGMLSVVSDNYQVRSNREAGTGRFDIQLEPRKPDLPGFLFEFKTKKDLEDPELERLAETGLKQIKTKEYTIELESRNIYPIHLYGVGFSGKKVAVKHEVVENRS
ncbi:MAG: PD-(D/E)XK nuclease domain-containing protein [Dorea sp.]|nr:PD-(D/E)XK nuclease domain-containing protein [Dorea sp.]